MSSHERFHPSRMRRNDTTRKNPTPAATVKMSTRSGTAGVWRASTCRSGSATGMITPITKQAATMSHSLFERVSCVPTCSPMGIMAMSAPSVKKPMPRMSSAAPARNSISVESSMGTTTIRVIGMTALSDSWILSFSFLFISRHLSMRPGIIPYVLILS